jgi:hypothetical protein
MDVTVDRRKARRAEVEVPIQLRLATPQNPDGERSLMGKVKNVSLTGVYCQVKAPCPLHVGEPVICSVSVPKPQRRYFPFSSLRSRGWVTRLEPLPMGRRHGEVPAGESLLGVGLCFASDVMAFGALED